MATPWAWKPALLLAVSSLSLSIYCFALPWFCFAFRGFEDAVSAPRLWTNWPSLGLESCWGSAVSQPCPTEPLADEVATPWPWKPALPLAVSNLSIYCFALPWFCFAFSGFEDAVSAPRLWTHWPSLGLESCWGSTVSQPCPTKPLADEVATPWAWKPALLLAVSNLSIYCFALPWFCFAFSGFEDAVSAPLLPGSQI